MSANNTSSDFPTFRQSSVGRILLKALALYLLANLVFATWYPMPLLGRISLYNNVFPGRLRLPYAENPAKAYNLSLFNLEAMLASHELSFGRKPNDEFRVILIGDSSTWGFLLPAGKTLSAQLDEIGWILPDGRRARFYNLGYPVMSLLKDALILSFAMRYQPDLILWPITLESFPSDKQLAHPLLQNNPALVRNLIENYSLNLDNNSSELLEQPFLERTLIGARRPLADLARLQLYGVLWAATGIDQEIPESYTPRQEDLEADEGFHDLQPPHLQAGDLSFDVLDAGMQMAGGIPVLLVNEPMFISQGQNSHIRYNFFYPRWAYDDYRNMLGEVCQDKGWWCLDLWDAIPGSEFTNSAVHLSETGTRQFAALVIKVIQESIK